MGDGESRHVRVLHVAEVVLGGITTYLDELLPWQGQRYGKNSVVLLMPDEHVQNLSATTREMVTVVAYRRSGRNLSSFLRLQSALRQQASQFRPQVIHAHSSFAGFIARGFPQSNIPVVYTPNGWSFDRDDSGVLRHMYASAESFLANRAVAIVTCSEHETEAAVKAGILRERLRVIPHGIGTQRLITEKSSFGARSGPLRLLYVGRLDRQKGFDWLLDAIEPFNGDILHLTVAGKAVLEAKRQGATRPNIHYAGWVAQNDLDRYIDACDAVIMPSRWEGFPFVALETMRRGRALLVSRRGALPEMVGHGEAGMIFGLDDFGELRQLLHSLTRAQLEQLGEKARERFVQNYTSEKMNSATDALYHDVCHEAH